MTLEPRVVAPEGDQKHGIDSNSVTAAPLKSPQAFCIISHIKSLSSEGEQRWLKWQRELSTIRGARVWSSRERRRPVRNGSELPVESRRGAQGNRMTSDKNMLNGAVKKGKVLFRQYVAGKSPNSLRAVRNLKAICRRHFDDCCTAEIVEVGNAHAGLEG
jgi:hypothetical protein